MPEPLKNLFSKDVILRLGEAVSEHDASFDLDAYINRVLDRSWKNRELKERMHHIAQCLYEGMSGTYRGRMRVLMKIGPQFSGLTSLVFPDMVEMYGLDDWPASMKALEVFTPLCSSEFAIRPFIIRAPVQTMEQMTAWAKSKNEHVRRLASEGCRPRLPWAMALAKFKKDPAPVLPILEILRCDPSEYVRRSVANNLNDISKDHPGVVLRIARRWLREKPETEKLLKHACRTLLKKGDQRALKLFGVAGAKGVNVTGLRVRKNRIKIGGALEFEFTVHVSGKNKMLLRLEYSIDFLNANGSHGRKVFKISEREFSGSETITRRHRVQDMTTRVHRPGLHHVHVVVNGCVMAGTTFELMR